MGWTDWRNLRMNRGGVIADTPATGIRWRYPVDMTREHWEFDPPTGTARYRVVISGPDGTVLLDQRVTFRYTLTTLVANGLLVIFTWWLDTNNAHVTTTIPNPVVVIGDEKPTYIPYGFGDVIAGQAHMMFDLYSAPYLLNIPAGSTFDMREMNIGTGLMDADGIIQTSVLESSGVAGARMPEDGLVRLVNVVPAGLEFLSSCDVRSLHVAGSDGALWPWSASPRPAAPQVSTVIPGTSGASAPLPFYLHQIQPVVFYQAGTRVRCVVSEDDGSSWRPTVDVCNGTLVAGAMGPEGGTVYLVVMRGSVAWAVLAGLERDSAGQFVVRAVDEYEAVGLPSLSPGGLLHYVNGQHLLIVQSGSAVRAYASSDMMRSWT